VTFGTTDSNPAPFDTNGEAGDAASDIASALGTYGIVSSASFHGVGLQFYCVDQGAGLCIFTNANNFTTTGWTIVDSVPIANFNNTIALDGGGGAWYTEFSPEVPTPEPGDLMLTLTGVVLLGLMVVMRKRVANRHPQAT
jgi:hypothetical protein